MITQIHEEDWSPDDVIVMHRREDGRKEAREILAHAAPDMARELLAILKDGNVRAAVRAEIEVVLMKAGVLLP